MKRNIAIVFTIAIVFAGSYFYSGEQIKTTAAPVRANEPATYGKVPLSFEHNKGQTDGEVKYLSRGSGYALFLTRSEAVLRLKADNCKVDEKDCERRSGVLRIGFDGANEKADVSGADELSGKSNYLDIDGARTGLSDIPTFERVQYRGIYEGVDLVFYGNERELEYDFNVQPFADPGQIKLNFDGADDLIIDAKGDLIARVAGKDVNFSAPVAYQTIDGTRHPVDAKYVISEGSKITFALGQYDNSQPLVIDPILQYASYLGGDSNDYGSAIVVNAAGEAYVAGQTFSSNFPTANAIQVTLNGTTDGFLTKFNAAGSGVIFSTFLGGADGQGIYGIGLDANGNIALTGTDTRNMHDIFVGKLNATGSAIVYPTVFIGGSGQDSAEGLDLDAAGNVYVTGRTTSTNFPTTAGVVQPNDGPGIGAFALRVNANGTIGYATYLDGVNDNLGYDIAVDGAGNAYIAGSHANASGVNDIFVLKINPTGSALVYPTFYFGGANGEYPTDIEIDDAGNAYIGGSTTSDNFPTTPGVIQPTFGGNTAFSDGFVAKVNPSGNGLVWATYLGSTSSEDVRSLKLDSSGGVYVTGQLLTTGDSNFYVAHLNSTATALDYNAQFGGTSDEFVRALAVDQNDDIYLTGWTESNDYPTTAGAFDRDYNFRDTFIMKINAPETPGATTLNINVPGNAVLNNEKLVAQLNAGDTVTISNIGGQVNFDSIDNVPACTYIVNANGLSREVYNTNQVGCYNNEWTANDPLPGASQGHAGLYMMRGSAKTFIGTGGATFTATASQRLYLGVNDVPFTGGPGGGAPNSGSFSARVTITPGASQTTVSNINVPGNSTPGNERFVTNLTTGDQVTVDNASGQVTFDSIDSGNGCIYTSSADGLSRAVYNDQLNQIGCYAEEWNNNDPLQAASSGHAGLYLMGGTAKTFVGTSRKTFTTTTNQPLYLGINDAGNAPNSGSYTARVTITRPASTTLNVNVPGNSIPDNEKFITQLSAGDQVTINNISGTVNFDTSDGTTDCVYTTNANGYSRAAYDANAILCFPTEYYYYNGSTSVHSPDPLPGANQGHAGLYMMRGSQKTFIGLGGSTFTAAADQPLYLGINDGGRAPNSGAFNARVIINRAATVEPTLSVSAVNLQEGNAGTQNAAFVVSLSPAATQAVTVRYQTADGTATAGADYTAIGNTLTFAPGDTSKTVNVPVIGDTTDEPDEYFTLQLINPTNATTIAPRGRANIGDDDQVPSIVVTDAGVTEGNSGTINANFNVTLSSVSGNTVTVNYATANGTAVAPGDYTAAGGTLTFTPGQTGKLVQVPVLGDTIVEPNETFTLNLSAAANATIGDAQGTGTITNDDIGGTIRFSTATASVNEAAGTVSLIVNRSGGAASGVTVNYATANGTATAGQDYTARSGTLTFGADENIKTIDVPITNDTSVESSETFTVNLSSPSGGGALGSPATSTVTIVDNDTCSYSISPGSQSFGASGGTGTINVTAQTGCTWTATEGLSWVTISGGASGSGNGMVTFTVAGNTGSSRTGTITAAGQTFTVSQAGAVSRRAAFDFDGDGKTDPSVYRPSQNAWYLLRSQLGFAAYQFGATGDSLVPMDYTGDGKTDVAVWRPSGGMWYILRSEDLTLAGGGFGQSGDIVAPGDYDGDGKADMAVYRPGASSTFFVQRSTAGFAAFSFGIAEDKPTQGDFDGDGKTDYAVYRPSLGAWYRINSSSNSFYAIQFGAAGDRIVPADYTGDGRTDAAVWRESTGVWFVLKSEDLQTVTGGGFGQAGDIPSPGDFDGDGKTDFAVYRQGAQSVFYTLQTTNGFQAIPWGLSGDKPTPNSFVY